MSIQARLTTSSTLKNTPTDMPVAPASPPKRMTRARAKAVEQTTTTAARKSATAATASSKRKAKSNDTDAEQTDGEGARSSSAKIAVNSDARPRGRPRKNTVSKDAPATAVKTRATGPTTASRKKVTFKEEDEKENVKAGTAAAKKSTTKSQPVKSTMNAKPVRKAVAKKTPAQPRVPSPLSPKKDTQVAKGNAANGDDSGDELELDCGPCVSPRPSKVFGEAKRPPVSPFKNSLKESPRKLPLALPRQPAHTKEQQAGSPPRSMLSQSPKKIMLGQSMRETQFTAPIEPLGSSLLRSPARRPASPIKGFPGFPLGSPSRISSHGLDLTTSVLKSKTPQRFNLSPAKNLTRAFKAAKSEGTFKIELDELTSSDSSKFESVLETVDVLEKEASDVDADEEDRENIAETEKVENLTFEPRAETPADNVFDDDSEDELLGLSSVTNAKSPSAGRSRLSSRFEPVHSCDADAVTPTQPTRASETFTGLANRFSQWQGATPDSVIVARRRAERSMFSPPEQLSQLSLAEEPDVERSGETPLESAIDCDEIMADADDDEDIPAEMPRPGAFGEDFAIAEDEDELMMDADYVVDNDIFRQSQMSQASQDYGDENVAPIDPAILAPRQVPAVTCTPSNVMHTRHDVLHTVSRVPLKPAADYDTPIKVAKKRSHSLSGSLTPRTDLGLQAMRQIYPSVDAQLEDYSDTASTITTATSRLGQTLAPSEATPRRSLSGSFMTGMTPGKADRHLLKGAVVYVDVHTAEGAEASSIFVELLTQMGAKCVKSWTWNSRASVGASGPNELAEDESSDKVGITHVVFKDGGKRTMEKVRQAKGRVYCVGVGWVLDCERENRWVDEADYEVDSALIPRGGQRRRKSMEPKSLSGGRYSLSASSRKSSLAQMSPTKEFLDLSTPLAKDAGNDRRVSFAPEAMDFDESPSTPKAAAETRYNTPPGAGYAESSFGSPTTPYFLHPAQLVQQTCPPKQNQELFFPVSGRIEEAETPLQQRLQLARRKSLQFMPRVGSPLGRK